MWVIDEFPLKNRRYAFANVGLAQVRFNGAQVPPPTAEVGARLVGTRAASAVHENILVRRCAMMFELGAVRVECSARWRAQAFPNNATLGRVVFDWMLLPMAQQPVHPAARNSIARSRPFAPIRVARARALTPSQLLQICKAARGVVASPCRMRAPSRLLETAGPQTTWARACAARPQAPRRSAARSRRSRPPLGRCLVPTTVALGWGGRGATSRTSPLASIASSLAGTRGAIGRRP